MSDLKINEATVEIVARALCKAHGESPDEPIDAEIRRWETYTSRAVRALECAVALEIITADKVAAMKNKAA